MSKLRRTAAGFERVVSGLSAVLMWVCAVLLFAVMIIICYEVSLRYAFNTSTVWSFEVTEYILLALSVLSLAYIQARGKHIKVDFIFDRFKPRAQMATSVLTSAVALFLFIMFTIAGWQAAWEAWTMKIVSWSTMAIPQFPVRVVVPIGSFVICLYLIVELSRHVLALRAGAQPAGKSVSEAIEIE